MRQKKLTALALLCVFIFISCAEKPSVITVSDNTSSMEITSVSADTDSASAEIKSKTTDTEFIPDEPVSIPDELNIPDYIHIEGLIPDAYPEKATFYQVEYFQPEAEKLWEVFLTDVLPEGSEEAIGTRYVSKDNDILITYGGVLHGGAQYSSHKYLNKIDKENLKTELTKNENYSPDLSGNSMNEMLTVFSEHDLSFMRVEELPKLISHLSSEAELPAFSIQHLYTRDKSSLQNNLEIYNRLEKESKERSGLEYMPVTAVFTDEDEDYLLILQETLDGIGILNKVWRMTDNEDEAVIPTVEIKISAEGIMNMEMRDLLQIVSENDKKILYSPEQALSVYIMEQEKSLALGDIYVIGIELNYVICGNQEEMTAVPAWVITDRREGLIEGEITQDYHIMVLRGDTLQILRNAHYYRQGN